MANAICRFTREDKIVAFNLFAKDRLFFQLHTKLKRLCKDFSTHLDICEVWDEALIMTKTVLNSQKVSMAFDLYMKELFTMAKNVSDMPRDKDDILANYPLYEMSIDEQKSICKAIACCSYIMIVSMYCHSHNERYLRIADRIINHMSLEKMNIKPNTVSFNSRIPILVASGHIDYIDYAQLGGYKDQKNKKESAPESQNVNEEKEMEELKQRIKELEEKLLQKDKEITLLQKNVRAKGSYDKKVVAKILIQLLVNKSTYGKLPAKMNRATLLSRLTGFGEDALKKLTDPDKIKLTERDHGIQVREAKRLLSNGDVTIKLEIDKENT